MNGKNTKKLILLFGVIMGIISFTPSNAVSLTLNFDKYIEVSNVNSEIRLIHFSEFKNDFGGLFYFRGLNDIFDTTADNEVYEHKIEDGEKSVNCKDQLKGFYYNAERGERLWPIDEGTMNERGFTGLSMTGGIYANCTPNLEIYQAELDNCTTTNEGEEGGEVGDDEDTTSECVERIKEKYLDMFSFYGGVTHEYSGQNFVLAVGVEYGTGSPWIEVKPQLGKTFQWIEGEGSSLPFGLIYDNLGGVGFAGCKIENKGALTKIVEDLIDNTTGIIDLFHVETGSDNSKKLVYNGNVDGEGNTVNLVDCDSVLENADSALKILVEGLIGMGKDIEHYKIKDNKDSLQKTQYFASANINNATLMNYAIQKAETLCRGKWDKSNSPNLNKQINCLDRTNLGDLYLPMSDRNKTIIVKNGNVIIEPFNTDENNYYDIFIDSGNLIINESSVTRFLIKTNGFVGSNDDEVIQEFNTKCDEIMRDPTKITDPDKFNELQYIGLASILKGNFIVNGSIKGIDDEVGLTNKYFIYGKVTSLDNNDELANTFKWRCNGGITYENGGNRSYCPGPNVNGKPNQYQNAPLVIIDQNYNSPMLKGL